MEILKRKPSFISTTNDPVETPDRAALVKELNRDFRLEINDKFVGAGTVVDRWGLYRCFYGTRKLSRLEKDVTIIRPKKGLKINFRVR